METTSAKQGIFKSPWVQSLAGIIVIAALLLGALVWKTLSSRVSIDRSVVEAPVISVGPETEGVLQEVYVEPGQMVERGQVVAQVGAETLSAQIAGLVISTTDVPGQIFMPGQAVVTMIDPAALRVVGTIDENKGLSKVKVGDPVSFTVDAFGSQSFAGIVEEIAPTSNDSGVAFTISDKRETKQFDVKVRYDTSAHPEFRNGMSAKVKVYPTK